MKASWIKIIWSLLIFLTLISINASIVYHIHSLDGFGIVLSLILSIVILIIILKYTFLKENFLEDDKSPEFDQNKKKFLPTIYILTWITGIYILVQARTSESIVSPWQKIPELFFFIIFAASALCLILIVKKNYYSKYLLHLHFFLAIGVCTIIYKIAYGFDPFIHEVALKTIKEEGLIEPKTWYYIGQYSLIIVLNKITFIPITILNKFLVPVLAAFFIPWALRQSLKKYLGEKNTLLTIFFLLTLPLSIFIITVPQNLAYIFVIIALSLALRCQNYKSWFLILLFSLAALLTHPVAGIPALLFSFALAIHLWPREKVVFLSKKYAYLMVYLVTFFSIPLALIYGAGAKFKNIINFQAEDLFSFFSLKIPSDHGIVLNFVYLYGFNWFWLVAGLVLAGIVISYGKKTFPPTLFLYKGIGAALLLSYILSILLIDFNFLIDYERNEYSKRFLTLAVIFLLPFVIITFNYLIIRSSKQKWFVKFALSLLILAAITASIYLSYPRFDPYYNSRFYSLSQSDIKAVNRIEEKSGGQDYVVLANQQVSAAALKEFGFSRYFKNDIYFYPIPTGGKLYQYYLDMAYEEPNQKTMNRAMDLTNVDLAYFVINEYWWGFDRIKEKAKTEAKDWEKINQGKIYIFEFRP